MQAKLYKGFKQARPQKKAKPLLNVFNETDYNRFKAEFTTKIPISIYVGNTFKSYLARVEKTKNKKQMIKLIKEEAMTAAIEVNRYLDDDERRFSGPDTDLIIKDKKYNLKIMTVEISGSPQKVNQTHFLEDRNKTAKNSKAMFSIFSRCICIRM
ncbi:hypothetical protein BD560DRAFT_424323 [Blakeslea trispora]|nr:hypothetical protein BD560DRAFT_424323 [Blakeslea trispora]